MFQRILKRCSHSLIDVSKPVSIALAENKPVVALETTILTHGMPYPANLQTALAVEEIIKEQGAVPATIGVVKGRVKVGLDEKSLAVLASPDTESYKISRRDFPVVIGRGLSGGTTVSGTLLVSKLIGIDVFVTGGIGGVHRDVLESMDISADLLELSRSPIMVVSSGVKSILDIGRTLENLETLGVCVVTYDDSKDFPAFYTRKSGYQSVYNTNCPQQAAELLFNVKELGLQSGILLGVPIPEEYSLNEQDIQNAIEKAMKYCKEKNISGKLITPFTKGRSLDSNIALIKNNAIVGSKIAVALQKKKFLTPSSSSSTFHKLYSTRVDNNSTKFSTKKVVVIGGSNMDIVVRPDEPLQIPKSLYDEAVKKSYEHLVRIGELNNKLNTAQLFAAKLEFILLYRNKITRIEQSYVKGMPSTDSDYLEHFTSKLEFRGISNQTILGKKHFRAWLWLLVEGNEDIFTQLTKLRKSLKYDVTKYIWFADKIQGTFELLSDDHHTEGRELDVKFFVPAEVKNYVEILSPDLREAAKIFFISEGWITET